MSKVKIILIIIIIAALGSVFYWLGSDKKIMVAPADEAQKARVIQEKLTIPDTTSFTGAEGRVVDQGSVAVALVPKSDAEKVIVPGAELSVKGVYDLSLQAALEWSSDAKLVFIKSLGAVTLDGKSSQWQIAFSSSPAKISKETLGGQAKKSRGYEVIIQKNQIVSQKEIESAAIGEEVPANFANRDSSWAIARLADIPQFQTASITAIVFSYNQDANGWDYIIPNSFGKTAIRVR